MNRGQSREKKSDCKIKLTKKTPNAKKKVRTEEGKLKGLSNEVKPKDENSKWSGFRNRAERVKGTHEDRYVSF